MRDRDSGPARTPASVGASHVFVLALAAFLVPAIPARAGMVSASLSVSVVVPARALLSVESQPPGLEITEEDVARGWVEPPPSSVRVRTNSPNGWLLEFEPLHDPYRSLLVTGLGSTAQVGGAGGWLAQPYTGKTVVTAELRYRIVLSKDARPGVYPWPVALSATPR